MPSSTGTGSTAAGGTFESDTGGTYQSDTPGTFQTDTDGTFHSAMAGTFQSDTGGTSIPLLSEKAQVCPNNDPNVWRKDQCGAWINRNMYGAASKDEPHTSYKWQIDHIKPDSKGGPDTVSNARPLQWYNNDSRQNNRLKTKVTADGAKNIEVTEK